MGLLSNFLSNQSDDEESLYSKLPYGRLHDVYAQQKTDEYLSRPTQLPTSVMDLRAVGLDEGMYNTGMATEQQQEALKQLREGGDAARLAARYVPNFSNQPSHVMSILSELGKTLGPNIDKHKDALKQIQKGNYSKAASLLQRAGLSENSLELLEMFGDGHKIDYQDEAAMDIYKSPQLANWHKEHANDPVPQVYAPSPYSAYSAGEFSTPGATRGGFSVEAG